MEEQAKTPEATATSLEEMISKGRAVVREMLPTPHIPDTQLMAYYARAYTDSQVALVDRTGRCEYRCQCDLVELGPSRKLVCPATLEPCPTRAVQPLVELFGKINRNGNSSTQ